MDLLASAKSAGLSADYVLFDSWFSNPVQITAIKEMADITFCRSLSILMDALMASLQEILKLSEAQLAAFTTDFERRVGLACKIAKLKMGVLALVLSIIMQF